jgi:hypothetical protein
VDGITLALTFAVAVPALARLGWFAQFAALSVRGVHGWSARRRALLDSARLPTAIRGDAQVQQERLDISGQHTTAAYTIGGLALAAWSILVGGGADAGAFALTALALAVLVSIGATVLFRLAGGELTRMGHESALAVSGLLMVTGMLALAVDRLDVGRGWAVAGAVVAAGLGARDVAETATQARLTAAALTARRTGGRLEPPPRDAPGGPPEGRTPAT